jgi:hypothetical protein
MLEDCAYSSNGLLGQDCLITSLDTINSNFSDLESAACTLSGAISQRLKIQEDSIPVGVEIDPQGTDTFTLNFSGGAVAVYNDPPYQTARKTVFVPITGVESIECIPTVIDNTLLYPELRVVNSTGRVPGEGHLTLQLYAPDPPRQIRTFFYHGPTDINAAQSNFGRTGMDDDKKTRPSDTNVESFVNNLLATFTINRLNDEVYVIYQKTARTSVTSGGKAIASHDHNYSGSRTIPDHVHTVPDLVTAGAHSHTASSGTGGNSDGVHYYSTIRTGLLQAGHSSHSHTYPGASTNGSHTHPVNNTNLAGGQRFDVNRNTDKNGQVTIAPATIDRYIPNSFVWKLMYDGNTYKTVTGFPKSVVALGADSINIWRSPHKEQWTKY